MSFKIGRIAASLILFSTLLARSVFAGSGKWTSGGPQTGSVISLVVDPRNADILYAGTDGAGVFQSADRGQTWRSSGIQSGRVVTILIDSVRPDTIYAASSSDVFKSTDAGASWSRTEMGLSNRTIYTLAFDVSNSATVYAGTAGGLYRSTDGGLMWQPTGLTDIVSAVAVDPRNSSVLYAATSLPSVLFVRSGGVKKSTDGGTTWISSPETSAGPPLAPSIVIDPSDPDVAYMAWGIGSIYKTIDAGAHWSRIMYDPSGSSLFALALDPSNPSTVYAATGAGIYKSTNAALTWSLLPGPAGNVTSIAFSPSSPQTIYAGTSAALSQIVLGPPSATILHSSDSGETWVAGGEGLINSSIRSLAVDPADARHVLAAASPGNLWETRDGGGSWTSIPTNVHGQLGPIVFDPRDGSTLLSGYNFLGSCFGLLRSADQGRTWSTTSLPLGCLSRIVFDPRNPTVIYAAHGAGILKSTDGGATWENTPLFENVVALVVDSEDSLKLYAGSLDHGVFKTVDGGRSWTPIDAGLPLFGSPPSASVSALAIDPSDSRVLFVALNRLQGLAISSLVFKSVDAGASWTEADSGLDGSTVHSLVLDSDDPRRLFAGTESGVFASTDGATTWFRFSWGLPAVSVTSLSLKARSRILYAGTSSAGVFVYEFPLERDPLSITTGLPRKARSLPPR